MVLLTKAMRKFKSRRKRWAGHVERVGGRKKWAQVSR
jgi:hypothetical protein